MADEYVSGADTEGLEAEMVEEYASGEVGLLGIVAAAIAADLAAGAATDLVVRTTGLNLLRNRVRAFVQSLTGRGERAARSTLAEARLIGRSVAGRVVDRRAGTNGSGRRGRNARVGRASGTERSDVFGGTADGDVLPDSVGTPDRPTAYGPAGDPNDFVGATTRRGSDRSAGGRTAAAGGPRHARPDPLRRDYTLDDLRATAPRGPRSARGVTIRTPRALEEQVQAMAPAMIASAGGLYQRVIAEVAAAPLTSDADRLRLAQRLLDDAAKRGLTGFTTAGNPPRQWRIESYIEMATRTAAAQTAIDAHCALLAEHGYDLVRVSVHENCSPLCAPFQGHLLSVTGATTSEGPEPWRSRVKASLVEARNRGFNHPNCKHYVQVWVPGDDLPEAPEVDPAHYKAEQQLRALERRLRAARRVEAVALDDAAAASAQRAIRHYRSQIESHVAAHPTVLRKPHRERIDGPL